MIYVFIIISGVILLSRRCPSKQNLPPKTVCEIITSQLCCIKEQDK